MTRITRRDFLSTALFAPFALQRDARFISTVPLGPPGNRTPLGRLLGKGLDARLFTDLSTLTRPQSEIRNPPSEIRNPQSDMVTPADRFFVRTACPSAVTQTEPWTIRLGGVSDPSSTLDLRALEPLTVRGPRCLIECSGNADPSNFGLMSAADW